MLPTLHGIPVGDAGPMLPTLHGIPVGDDTAYPARDTGRGRYCLPCMGYRSGTLDRSKAGGRPGPVLPTLYEIPSNRPRRPWRGPVRPISTPNEGRIRGKIRGI